MEQEAVFVLHDMARLADRLDRGESLDPDLAAALRQQADRIRALLDQQRRAA